MKLIKRTCQIKPKFKYLSNIKNYFNSEINQRNVSSKKLSKYISVFDYIDKIFIVLSETTEGVYIISHAAVVSAPVGIANAGFTIVFSLRTEIIKRLLKNNKKQKEKI